MTTPQVTGSSWSDTTARLAVALYDLAAMDQTALGDSAGAVSALADRIELSPQALEALSHAIQAEAAGGERTQAMSQAGLVAAYDPAMVAAGNTGKKTTVADVLMALERLMRPAVSPDDVAGGGTTRWIPVLRSSGPAQPPAATAAQPGVPAGGGATMASAVEGGAGQSPAQSAASLPPDPTETTPAFDVGSFADLPGGVDGSTVLPAPGQPVSVQQALRGAVQLAGLDAMRAAGPDAVSDAAPGLSSLTPQDAAAGVAVRADGTGHMSATQAWATAYDMPVDELVPMLTQVGGGAMQAAAESDPSPPTGNAGAGPAQGALLSLSLQMLEAVLENPDDALFQAFRPAGPTHGPLAQAGHVMRDTSGVAGQGLEQARAALDILLNARIRAPRGMFLAHGLAGLRGEPAFQGTGQGAYALPATHADSSGAFPATAAGVSGFDLAHLLPEMPLNAEMLGGSALVSVFAMGWALLLSGYQPRGYLPVPWARRGRGEQRWRDRQAQPDAPVSPAGSPPPAR
ncbi:MAG: hypothetical protein ABF535_02930 [Acetobacter sp.]